MANQETRQKIIEYATAQYIEHGCRRITMDDISNGMHISKRTLYETFINKETLLSACLTTISHQLSCQWRNKESEGTASIILMLSMFYKLANCSQNLSLLIADSKRYYPKIYNDFFQLQTKFTDENLRIVLNKAHEAHLLRPSIEIERVHSILSHFFNKVVAARIENLEIISESGFTFMRGLLSSEAIAIFDQQEQNIRNILE